LLPSIALPECIKAIGGVQGVGARAPEVVGDVWMLTLLGPTFQPPELAVGFIALVGQHNGREVLWFQKPRDALALLGNLGGVGKDRLGAELDGGPSGGDFDGPELFLSPEDRNDHGLDEGGFFFLLAGERELVVTQGFGALGRLGVRAFEERERELAGRVHGAAGGHPEDGGDAGRLLAAS